MRHATENDLKVIYAIFQQHRDVFPHVRQDALKRRIEAHQCINQDGVIITFQQYKNTRSARGWATCRCPLARSCSIRQIVNTNQFNGAGGRVFEQFVEEIVKPSGGDLYLSVRKENAVACRFYERHGMSVAGKVEWSAGTIPGLVYSFTETVMGPFPVLSVFGSVLNERVPARDGDYACRLQLRCGCVNIPLIQSGELANFCVG
jgi:hypothetical protein